MAPKVCKRCQTYLLDHDEYILRFHGWKKCPSCGWCCDKEGYNLINKKENADEQKVAIAMSEARRKGLKVPKTKKK